MALTPDALNIVHQALRTNKATGCNSQTVLALGYPDVLISADELVKIFGSELAAAVTYRDDSAAIARWHGISDDQRIPEAVNLFALLGYDLEILDVATLRGGELLHDLNQAVPQRLHRRYALILDVGTLEHCFNIAQAAVNVAQMAAPGGRVFHANPLNMFNHGFYNLNPTWYHDFYRANGFELEALYAVSEPSHAARRYAVPHTRRFQNALPRTSLHVLVRRVADTPIVWPTQTKYANNNPLTA